jgi:hypothetical protein
MYSSIGNSPAWERVSALPEYVVVVVVVVVCLRRGPGRSLRRPFEGRLGVGANIMCPPD